jgi:hypothetical protein
MSTLEKQKLAVLNRENTGAPFTIVSLHCEQCREWGTRGGNIEITPLQDSTEKFRFNLIDKIWNENQLEQRMDYIMDCFTCRGEILWLVLPDNSMRCGYTIDFYVGGLHNPDPQYRVFYKPGGRQIERISICYDYEIQGSFNTTQFVNTANTQLVKKWVRIDVDGETITVQENLDQKPDLFSLEQNNTAFNENGQSTKKIYLNSFAPFVPVTISRNNQRRLGQQGSDDFTWLQSMIETHDKLVSKSYHNLNLFSNPIFVTSRNQQEVMSGGGNGTPSQTWGSANRFVSHDPTGYSTNTQDIMNYGEVRYPGGRSSVGGLETSAGTIDTIISNVGQDERFGFVQPPSPVGGDHNMWIKQIRELIHWSLGGVDPVGGMTSGSTWGEIKTLFGRVQNMADKKMVSLMQFGLCEIFEKIIYREETMWKTQFFDYITKVFPNQYPFQSADQIPDQMCQQFYQINQQSQQPQDPNNPRPQLPVPLPKFQGLLPFGDRTITWRYTRDVFQLTTRERLDLSIAGRNDREDGLSQEYVLRKQHPDMTDQEVKNAMSGFSPRVVGTVLQSIQQLISINGMLMQAPSPQNPQIPWAITMGLPQLIEQGIKTLEKELAYGVPQYEDATKTDVTYYPLHDFSLQNTSLNDNIVNNDNNINNGENNGFSTTASNISTNQLTVNSTLSDIIRTIASITSANSPGVSNSTVPSSTSNADAGLGQSGLQSTVPDGSTERASVFWANIDPNEWREFGITTSDAKRAVSELLQQPESVQPTQPVPTPVQQPKPTNPKPKRTTNRGRSKRTR